MSIVIATHNGPFHADDVTAVALLQLYWQPDASIVRTRDHARIDAADAVVDVGGTFDADRLRFDHHQASYQGPRSAAGMVLDWLESSGRVDSALADVLRTGAMEYLDAVDNGRTAPDPTIPCFPSIVGALGQSASNQEEFDVAFEGAVGFARAWITGIAAGHHKVVSARRTVREAMADAISHSRNVLFFDAYASWKQPYFELDGANHPTEFVLFPGTDGSWRIVAIPPVLGDFGQKRSLPEAWAGLTDDALTAVTGVEGSIFCHKNRFIAVFETREGALQALKNEGLLER